ncbi:DUF3152 domain-containing protein [Streptomyces sp. ST2-7A]|uniref:DUF3152 domain-containing protein n=1 Tax=Streptomyces sp. ST2-7A TaxID=2907214 RepID=UPI001F2B0F02|nr:DUF3152 domain-containing protein [Streptomyces sp. ST2-7A]MCE7078927.1 DUF3152 domain-containing protein [Streptomyces sp. ST2-7A]
MRTPTDGAGRRRPLGRVIGAVVATTVLALAVAHQQSSGPDPVEAADDGRPGAGDPDHPDAPADGEDGRDEGFPDEELSATSRPAPETPDTPVPESGPGSFRAGLPEEDAEAIGEGTPLRYRVQVEDGIDLDPDEAAAEVHAILGHPRGWTNDGTSAFLPVTDPPFDFSVKIATPATVDDICGQYGLDTGGEVNCRVGDEVMVNLRRWVEGSPNFPGAIGQYRALIVNHEVGHRLGHGHLGCRGPGEPAPAMMQQIKGLEGCEANPWPYDMDGEYIDGPWRP